MEEDLAFIPMDACSDEVKVFELALRRNTIVVAETEDGKNELALTLIKGIGKSLKVKSNASKQLVAVLASTVQRVHQLHMEIKKYVDLKVEEYYGAKGVDDWNSVTWEKEINERDVVVMTPQVLLAALRNAYINLNVFYFIILDECRQATGNHPLMKLVKEFCVGSTEKPRVFGMTTSPDTSEGFSSIKSKTQIGNLQSLLDTQVFMLRSNSPTIHMNLKRVPDDSLLKTSSRCELIVCTVESMEASICAHSIQESSQNSCEELHEKVELKHQVLPSIKESSQYACAELHEKEELKHQVFPSSQERSQNSPNSSEQPLASGAGTTKRKELHGSVGVSALCGTWGQELNGFSFYAYKMSFSCSIPTQKYSSYVLLLETKLDDDVGNIEVELFLISKFVKCSVSYSGQIYLDSEQVAQGKRFQELIFNGLYGKLFVNASGIRTFLLQTDDSLWDSLNMYLLLPLESENTSRGTPKINWTGIESCVSAVDFLKTNALLNRFQPNVCGEDSSTVNDPAIIKYDGNFIQLANKSVPLDSLNGLMVISKHTGRIYSVFDVIANSSARSPFEENADAEYSSFSDYFLKKYGIELKHPEQPLLLLKQGHNSHNLLVDFRNEGGKMEMEKKPQQHARLPPELLVLTDISSDDLKPFYLFPSVIHRLESFMLASQLRKEITDHIGKWKISSSLILEALTTLRCNETFSMERLEFLGDCLLKYAVSCHLFLKHPEYNESKLSYHRTKAVSNSYLHKLGIDRKLQMYIRDCAFEPRRWTAPGQRSIWLSPCQHEINSNESMLFSEDKDIVIGKTCDKGHRWIGSKTISDCVEALIGAYCVSCGLSGSIDLMKWLGIEASVEPSLIDNAFEVASLHPISSKAEDISAVESKLGYKFSNKGLLLEAITHDTQSVGYCYQRLEFLGDAVLGLLITQHLYENHKNIDPGELTELRSVAVSNSMFAIAAVKGNLHAHLQHSSIVLETQISEFVNYVHAMTTPVLQPDIIAPKALGDLLESLAGAVLIDSKLNLDEVWRVFEPLLSPIVTPEKLELPPFRALTNLCNDLGYYIKEHYIRSEDSFHLELKLQLEDVMLTSMGMASTKKAAKGIAAIQMLKKLEIKGVSCKKAMDYIYDVVAMENPKKRKLVLVSSTPEISKSNNNAVVPVLPAINTAKGGPRTALFELCKKQQWPRPTFNTTQENSRVPISFGDVVGFNSFESEISLTIPSLGVIIVTGEARADKKSSFDSAALLMLHELQRMGKIVIQPN